MEHPFNWDYASSVDFAPALKLSAFPVISCKSTPGEYTSSKLNSSHSSENLKKAETANYYHVPFISSKSWCVFDAITLKVLSGKQDNVQREIASLTKIMTCFTSLILIEELPKVNIECYTDVSWRASTMGGTSAKLKVGEYIQLWDLLHGLMLPSGNDAAICLAEYLGECIDPTRDPIQVFVEEMNQIAHQLGLKNTLYSNPHGLHNGNLSTARDLCKLSAIALKQPLFRQICNTARYTCNVISGDNRSYRELRWENTNKLLGHGFSGVKTGTTKAAGPCLCTNYKFAGESIVTTLLNSRTSESRWMEATKLTHWAIQNLI